MVTTFWLSPFHARRLSRYNAIYTLVALVPQQASDEGLGLVLVGRRGKTSRARSGLHTRVFLCDPSLVCKTHPEDFEIRRRSDRHADALFYGLSTQGYHIN